MRIPSMQALRALDSFARHGSVWRAADELSLTRSAVSHQLRLLERDLGFELLERIGKGVALTVRGKRYASDVRKALAMLGDAGSQRDRQDRDRPVERERGEHGGAGGHAGERPRRAGHRRHGS